MDKEQLAQFHESRDSIVRSEIKNRYQKKFTSEDEIVLLRGLQIFWANGRNNKWMEYYAFIKNDLSHEFTKTQVTEKIRRLREKFQANLKRSLANEGNLNFSEDHEALLYELSETLWEDLDTPSSMHDGNEHSITHKNKIKGDGESHRVKKRPLEEDDTSYGLETTKQDAQEKAPLAEAANARKRRDRRKSNHKNEKKSLDVEQNDGKKQILGIQKLEVRKKEFELAFPLVRATFREFAHPPILRDKCYLIGMEKGRELEEKLRELKKEEMCLRIKKLDLLKKHLTYRSK